MLILKLHSTILAGTEFNIDQEGGYMLKALESATVITLDDDSSVDISSFRSRLLAVTSLSDGSGAGTFTFAKATELHLTSLPRSPHAAFHLVLMKVVLLIFLLLLIQHAAGKDAKLDLTISGPDAINYLTLSGNKAGSDIIVSETCKLNC